MEMYDEYATELSEVIDAIVADNAPSGPTAAQEAEVHDLVSQMKLELRGLSDEAAKKAAKAKLAALEARLSDHRRTALMATGPGPSVPTGEKDRFQATEDKLGSQSAAIANAIKIAEETEGVGLEITGELARNREKIEGVQERIKEQNGLTKAADKMIKRMQGRTGFFGFFKS